MKILILTYNFQPEHNMLFGLPFAKALANRGHQVQVLTTFPNYPSGVIFDGYKNQFLFRETMNGIPVIRVPLCPSHDSSSAKRVLSYVSFALSASLIGGFAIEKADVAYVVQGPASNGLPAFMFKLFRRIPFVFDIKDLWPDSLTATGMFKNKGGLWLVDKWCKFCYTTSSKIVVPTPGIKEKLIERNVPERKIELVYNWCDEAVLRTSNTAEDLNIKSILDGKFNVVFAGNMGKAQALTKVLDAAKLVYEKSNVIQFVFVGDGIEVENLKEKSIELDLRNVLFIDRQPVNKIGSILSMSDVLFVHLKNEPLFRITIPSKIQAYMAAGKPILIGVQGDAADLVEKAKAGVACEPENPESIANAVKSLFELSSEQRKAMGKRARDYYCKNLSFEVGVSKYEKTFQSISNQKR